MLLSLFLYDMRVIELYESVRDAAGTLYCDEEAAALARLVIEEETGFSRIKMLSDPDSDIIKPANWDHMLEEIRSGRPIQYILGRTEFFGLDFKVREGVLIPRPETEELIDWVLHSDHDAESVLDIGTGSGAIAVTLAKRMPHASVRAIDISSSALEIARGNAADNGTIVEFLRVDILTYRSEWDGEWKSESYDVIISNPPYIPVSDIPSIHTNVREYEPHTALFVPDDDPLVFYRAIGANACWLLRSNGALYFEIYEHYAEMVKELLKSQGFSEIEVRKDINGKDRMVRCVKRQMI